MKNVSNGYLPSISVIIPSYNNGRFIGQAIESLLQQTYPRHLIEIIVIDDGSTDGTPDVLKEFGDEIVCVYRDHRGIAATRNAGFALSGGAIISFLDSDDVWHKDRLEKVSQKFLEIPPAAMVYHPVELIDSSGATISGTFHHQYGYRQQGLSGRLTSEIASGAIFSGGSAFSCKREVLGKVFPIPEDIRRGADYFMNVIASCHGSIEYIPEILGKYRLHDRNLTMSQGPVDIDLLIGMNRDFAHTRQRVIEKLTEIAACSPNLPMLKRMRAKEMIFCDVLSGRRFQGINRISEVFQDNPNLNELLRGIVVSAMALFCPVFLFPKIIDGHKFLRRIKMVPF